jgi:proteasome alpha subunit
VLDEQGFSVMGGEADAIAERLKAAYDGSADLAGALGACVAALAGPDRTITADELEVAVLERGAERRAFRRLEGAELAGLVPSPPTT